MKIWRFSITQSLDHPITRFLAVLCAILLLCGQPGAEAGRFPLLASLSFSGSTDQVDFGSAALLDNINTGTYFVWLKNDAFAAFEQLINKGNAAGTRHRLGFAGAGAPDNFRFLIQRATTPLEIISSDTPFVSNTWQCVAVTFDSGGGSTDQKLYVGSLTAPIAEVSSYSIQQAGSGAVGDDSGDSLLIGNTNQNNVWTGQIAVVAIWNRVLTAAEIRAQQFRPFCKASDGCVLFTHLGWAGTGTQPDLSGNGNNGTVTGASLADHVPIARWP